VVARLNNHEQYPSLFAGAFPNEPISKELVAKAIAQFERTLISANSKFDRYLMGEATLTPNELNGLNVFMDEARGDCFHCHGSPNNPLWTNNDFHNNGLDAEFSDLGLGAVTGDPDDNGKFRSPSMRNLAFTAPYMHDGRFTTLEEVIDFYSEGLQNSPTIDPLMKKIDQGGAQLNAQDKADLKAFLLTLSDPSFIQN
jgi:cytochrome c peroxidase